MNKRRDKVVRDRLVGTVGTVSNKSCNEMEDVDHLVEMINIDKTKSHQQSASNPKKAAKKARQKQKKEDEKRQKEEEERLQQLELERRRLAEEQEQRRLAKAMKDLEKLNISGGKGKKKKGKNNQGGSKNDSVSHANVRQGSDEPKKYVSKGVSCSLIGNDSPLGFSVPWRTYMGWDGLSASHDTTHTDYLTPAGIPISTLGAMQMKHQDQALEVDSLPHSFSQHPQITSEEKVGSIRLGSNLNKPESFTESVTQTQKKKKKKKKKDGSSVVNATKASELDPSARLTRINNALSRAGNTAQMGLAKSAQALIKATRDATTDASGDAQPAKPEMVTIRRHPSISDTTVTISIKNREGDEDVLYTLLNGQVVRSKPDGTVCTPIEEKMEAEASEKKKSKRKRNKRQRGKKETQIDEEQANSKPSVQMIPSFVSCNSVAASTPGTPKNSETNSPNLQKSAKIDNFPGVHLNESEIDLSRLRLPPGITITKVNQASSDPNKSGDKNGGMVRICNTTAFGPPANMVSLTDHFLGLSSNGIEISPSTLPGNPQETVSAIRTPIAQHSPACNCQAPHNLSQPQCPVQDPTLSANTHGFKPWFQQSVEVASTANQGRENQADCNETTSANICAPNPFQSRITGSYVSRNHLDGRKMKIASYSHGPSEKCVKRKQPRGAMSTSWEDLLDNDSSVDNERDGDCDSDVTTGSNNENSSFQAYALSLQHSLSQSHGRLNNSINTNFLGNGSGELKNFTFGSNNCNGALAQQHLFCSNNTS